MTQRLCHPLQTEDFVAQSMPDVSPTKWHLAHTAWFFETFLLEPTGWQPVHPAYKVLFNSYYNGIGEQFTRARRGLLTRPTVSEIWAYRDAIDCAVLEIIESAAITPAELEIVELGLQHEQQHQELLLTDIKHVLFQNPLLPAYQRAAAPLASRRPPEAHRFIRYDGGRAAIGHGGPGFCFDNELPRHEILAAPFALGSRLVTTDEYRAFIADGGYRRPELWLSEGWSWVNENDIRAPLYWLDDDRVFTLHGPRDQLPDEPVIHVSLYEADAYATWAGARLPREHELEIATSADAPTGNFVESGALHARPAKSAEGPAQIFGDAWEWTQSSYSPYPGYRAPAGAIGEYNGKFMCNQHVLRGGSCVTSASHMRASYRNFFPAGTRWQLTGIRVARDA